MYGSYTSEVKIASGSRKREPPSPSSTIITGAVKAVCATPHKADLQ